MTECIMLYNFLQTHAVVHQESTYVTFNLSQCMHRHTLVHNVDKACVSIHFKVTRLWKLYDKSNALRENNKHVYALCM